MTKTDLKKFIRQTVKESFKDEILNKVGLSKDPSNFDPNDLVPNKSYTFNLDKVKNSKYTGIFLNDIKKYNPNLIFIKKRRGYDEDTVNGKRIAYERGDWISDKPLWVFQLKQDGNSNKAILGSNSSLGSKYFAFGKSYIKLFNKETK